MKRFEAHWSILRPDPALLDPMEALWSVLRLCEAFRGSITLFFALCGSLGLWGSVGAAWSVLRLAGAFCGSMKRFEALLRSPMFSHALLRSVAHFEAR